MNKVFGLLAGVSALAWVAATPANAVTVFGNITDTNLNDTVTDGSSYDVANGPYAFNAFFTGPDGAGQANFKFTNSSSAPVAVAVDFETVNEGSAAFAGGVTSSWLSGQSHSTPGSLGTVDSFVIQTVIAPGGFDIMRVVFGNPGGNTITGPNFTLQVVATTPLPGALPLLASSLSVLGFAGWRKRNKAKAAA